MSFCSQALDTTAAAEAYYNSSHASENRCHSMIRLYHFGPAWDLPDPSPFCTKVITYLQLANIPFEAVAGMNNVRRAPKGKLPFIEDGGEIVADSGFIIPYLQKKHNNPVYEPSDPQERGALRAITRMLDEDLYFSIVYTRWLDEDNWRQYTFPQFFSKLPWPISTVVPAMIRRNVKQSLHRQGMGRHSPSEIMEIGKKDLAAVRDYLGNKPFIAGDQVSVADATVYAFVTGAARPPHASSMKRFVESDSTLMEYLARMDARLAQYEAKRVTDS